MFRAERALDGDMGGEHLQSSSPAAPVSCLRQPSADLLHLEGEVVPHDDNLHSSHSLVDLVHTCGELRKRIVDQWSSALELSLRLNAYTCS